MSCARLDAIIAETLKKLRILPSSTKLGTALSLPASNEAKESEFREREREVHPILSYDSATLVVLQRKAEAG